MSRLEMLVEINERLAEKDGKDVVAQKELPDASSCIQEVHLTEDKACTMALPWDAVRLC